MTSCRVQHFTRIDVRRQPSIRRICRHACPVRLIGRTATANLTTAPQISDLPQVEEAHGYWVLQSISESEHFDG